MGIQVDKAISQPAVTFNKVHLIKLNIEQPVFYDDGLRPIYNLVIEYRMYGVDADSNTRHYQGESHEIVIHDYLVEATTEAQKGNMNLVIAMQSIESAIASIIQNNIGVKTSIV